MLLPDSRLSWLRAALTRLSTSLAPHRSNFDFPPDLTPQEISPAPALVMTTMLLPSQVPQQSLLTRADGKRGIRAFLPAIFTGRYPLVIEGKLREDCLHTALRPFSAQTEARQAVSAVSQARVQSFGI